MQKLSFLFLLLTTPSVWSQTSYLMITHATPVAVQRGKTTEVVVEGQQNFLGAYKVLFEGAGLSATVVPNPPQKAASPQKPQVRSVKLQVTVAAEAALGVHEFRVASSLGISSIGQLVVVDQPVVQETGDNNSLRKANPVAAPGVICGRIEAAEDVDYFKIHSDAGQVLTCEMICARLEDKIHDLQKHADPLVALFDVDGRELAANDDYYFADSFLSFKVPKTGDYFLQVRDSKYDGDPRWAYAMLVTNRLYVSNVFPMAGNPGKTIEVEPIGSINGKYILQVPARLGLGEVQLDVNGAATNPTAFIASSLPQVLEQEPNDEAAKATRVTIPCGISGRIGVPRDLDCFLFAAKKGKAIRFEVKARRFGTTLQSSLDSLLEVMNSKGAVLASNDDTFGKDAALVFTPPADGDYVLRIRDLNSKGGPTAVYYLEADWARPDFTLRCDPDKAMIGPGSSTAWYVHVTRLNGFTGPVKVEVKDLPRGVSASPLTIPATMTQGLVVLTAAPDAVRDAANVHIVGTATADGEALERRATPNEEIYNPGGGRARFDVNMQTVAVTDPSDIRKVGVKPQQITLKPGQEVRIDVAIQRSPDYTKGVSIDVLMQHLGSVFGNPLPPGVTVVEGKSKTLLGAGNTGHITLKAADNAAPIENVPISVLAHVSINFVVKVSYSSPVILVSIRK